MIFTAPATSFRAPTGASNTAVDTAIGRAATDFSVILLDEPAEHVDRRRVRRELMLLLDDTIGIADDLDDPPVSSR